MNKRYSRVIPRDFFNESKLLKCMGQLSIKIHDCTLPDGITIDIADSGDPFTIALMDCGHLTITNYPVTVNGVKVVMKTTYNSKSNYPLLCELDYCDYPVFTESGDFNDEFINQFKK